MATRISPIIQREIQNPCKVGSTKAWKQAAEGTSHQTAPFPESATGNSADETLVHVRIFFLCFQEGGVPLLASHRRMRPQRLCRQRCEVVTTMTTDLGSRTTCVASLTVQRVWGSLRHPKERRCGGEDVAAPHDHAGSHCALDSVLVRSSPYLMIGDGTPSLFDRSMGTYCVVIDCDCGIWSASGVSCFEPPHDEPVLEMPISHIPSPPPFD